MPKPIFNPYEKKILRIYGPYVCAFNGHPRRQMLIIFVDGTRTGMAYARWLMTQKLRRRLLRDEHVDHVNEDQLDDRISNFQLLSGAENARKSALGRPSPQKGTERGWRHGTTYGWMKKKCRCHECDALRVQWHDARNKRRREASKGARGPYTKAKHGRISMYRYHECRCDLCRAANTEAARRRRELLDQHPRLAQ